MKKYAVGIDLGGTHLRIGLVDKSGKILDLVKIDNPKNVKDIITTIRDKTFDLVKENSLNFRRNISGIGVAVASPVNPETGKANWSRKLPFSKNFNLLKILKKYFERPVLIENDLNAAALGELLFGGFKGKKNGIIITESTGIGSGIILSGEIYRGHNFIAGEIGHMIVNPLCRDLKCNRGHIGCFEALASAKSAEQRYFARYKRKLVAEEIVKLAKIGDKKSLKILKEIGFWLGVGITNIINILDPEVIVIYGDFFLNIWPLIQGDIKKIVKKRSFNPKIIFQKTKLGDNGGVLGAASLIFKGK